MIRLAESMEVLRPRCGSAFGCQILSTAAAYGFALPFAQFWTDNTAAYGKLDGVLRIAGTVANVDETRAFLGAVGAERVFCSLGNAEKLDLRILSRGVVLQKQLAGHKTERTAPSVRDLYTVFAANGMVGDFEPFYLDLSHRLRHDAACAAEIREQNTAVAAAAAVYADSSALITAVGVLPSRHRRGYGRAVLRAVESQLGERRAYVLRAERENERFYALCGYAPCGAWCEGVLK